jgi:hypothetical protein
MDQENVAKKSGRMRRFFKDFFTAIRCIFIVLLVLLLIAGLYFQAPPKVLVLIAIILATLTIIPKRTRKWIWLSFVIIIMALVVWIFLPEDDGDWRPYTFDEELATLEAKRAIPDDQNAATIYNKLLETYDANDFKHDFIDDDLWELSRKEPWSSQDYPELAKWIQGHKETITILMQACKRDLCRFPLRPDMIGLEDTMDKLSPMRDWARLLIRTGSNNIGDGDIDDGIKKYVTVLQMAKHLYQQPSMLELITAIGIEALGRSQITRFLVLGDAVDERLSVLDKSLCKIHRDWASDWPKTLEYENLFVKNFWAMFYEVNSKGESRLSHNPVSSMRKLLPPGDVPELTYWQHKGARIGSMIGYLFLPSTPQKAGRIIDDSYEKYYAMAEPDFDWKKGLDIAKSRLKFNYRYLTEMIAAMLQGPYHKIHDHYLRNIGQHKGSRLVIALRRYKNKHGRWPERLEDVKSLAPEGIFLDPTNNDSFVYRLTDDGFTLYSKGKNNIDENGESRTKKPDGTETDDILIWPPKSRKAQQEVKTQN